MARPPKQSRRVGGAAETRSDALLREPELVGRMPVRREGEGAAASGELGRAELRRIFDREQSHSSSTSCSQGWFEMGIPPL